MILHRIMTRIKRQDWLTVFLELAVVVAGRVEASLHHFPGDRGEIRRRAAQAALASLYHELRAHAGGT